MQKNVTAIAPSAAVIAALWAVPDSFPARVMITASSPPFRIGRRDSSKSDSGIWLVVGRVLQFSSFS